MLFSELLNQKYFITYLKLVNFKGLARIANKDNEYELDLNDIYNKKSIVILNGENGYGKSTILENMHPYKEMISETRPISESINYPAYKTIIFKNEKQEIRCEIKYISPESTKGYVYINNALYQPTEKGNIVEYNKVVNALFLDFNKFVNSLFMQQDIRKIVSAKPSGRATIINNFSKPIVSYEEIKDEAKRQEDIIKGQIKVLKDDIENYKGYENRYEQIMEYEKNYDFELISKIEEEYEIKSTNLDKLKKVSELFDYLNNTILSIDKKLSNIDIEAVNSTLVQVNILLSENQNKLSDINILKINEELSILNNSKNKVNNILSKMNTLRIEDTIKINIEEKEFLKEKLNKNLLIKNNYDVIIHLLEQELKIKQAIFDLEEEIKEENKFSFEITSLSETTETLKQTNIKLKENIETLKSKFVETRNNISKYKELITKKEEKEKELEEFVKDSIIQDKLKDLEQKKYKLLDLKNEFAEISKIINSGIEDNNEFVCKHCKSALNKEELLTHKNELEKEIDSLLKLDLETNILKYFSLSKERSKIENDLENIITSITSINNIKTQEDLDDMDISIKELIETEEENTEKFMNIKSLELLIKNKQKLEVEYKEIKDKLEARNKLISVKEIKEIEDINDILKEINIIEETLIVIDLYSEELLNNISIKEAKFLLDKKISEYSENIKNLSANVNLYSHFNEEINKNKEEIARLNNIKTSYEASLSEKTEKEKELKGITFSQEAFELLENETIDLKNRLIEEQKKYDTYINDKEYIQKLMIEYAEKKLKIEDFDKQLLVLNKIKNYSERIKKAQVSNFFAGITNTINDIISSEEGSLKELYITIKQKGNKNLDIIASTGIQVAKDISYLSGAEKNIVAKGISLALAKENNFGIAYFDESDGMLSEGNKSQFYNTLRKTQDILKTNQLFVISHNQDLLLLADKVIKIK